MRYRGEVRRSCKFCRKRKMKCSGERPWCSNCKGKNKPCVYDTGTIRIKKQEEDVLQAARREAGTLALPGTSRSYTLYSELNLLYNRLWEQTRGYWAKQNATLGDGSRPQITAINYQHGLSQILRRTIDSLAVKTLPFGDQLQVPSIALGAGQSDQPGRYADTFTPVSIRILSGDGTFGKARLLQLIDLAFNSHPFLSAIVSRTLFLEDIEDETYDRQLFDCILIAALGLREHFAGAVGARACTEELPEIEDLIPKTTDILNRVKLGTLNASKMHVSIQCMMLLAWHELAQGFLKRASTWWTFVCGLLVQARYLAAQEDQLECIVNGVDKLVVKEEELNNMRAISQLLLLWLQLSLGSIPTHNALLSRSHVGREAPKLGSAMWELEEISGNISMVESFHASSTMVRNIESLLGCLTERFADHKMSKSPAARHPSTIYNDYELAWRVNTTLVQASTMCSSKIIAIPATSFAALLLCMQANRQDRSPMSAQRVDLIIKICAAVSLQLRDIFGDAEGLDSGSPSNGDLLISHMRARALSTAAMDEALVAVTMVEAIAHTFEGLLNLSSSDASPSNGNEVGDIFDLSDEARQHVVEKLGVIMGILCTIIDCFDNIPKRGKRAKQTASKLAGLRTRLEELNVQADVSFAFEVALSSSGSSQGATQETHPGVKQEPSFDFPSNTNELMPSQSSSNLQQTGPWAYEEVAAFDSSSYSRLAAGSQCNRAEAPSSYQTSPYVNHYAAQQPTGHVRYGPGPLSAAFREEKSSGEGPPDTTYPFTFGADLPGQHYHEPPARTTGYSGSTTFSSAAYSGSAQAQSLPYSYTAESSAHKTHIALASGQGVWEPTPGYAATRGYTQATQSYAGNRIAPVRFTDNYVEWH